MHPVILESAEATAQQVGTEYFAKYIGTTLNLLQKEIEAHLTPDDVPGMYIPLDVVVTNKDRTGGVLALQDRLILAWSIGMLRPKSHSVVIHRDEIKQIETTTQPATTFMKPRRIVRIDVETSYWLKLPWFDHEGGNDITPFAVGVIDGSMRPVLISDEEVAQ